MTFDATQRVVIGRGAGSDVRLPDASVSLRHAPRCVKAQGADFIVFDEAKHERHVRRVGEDRSADVADRSSSSASPVRVGRIWLELRIDQRARSHATWRASRGTLASSCARHPQALRDRGRHPLPPRTRRGRPGPGDWRDRTRRRRSFVRGGPSTRLAPFRLADVRTSRDSTSGSCSARQPRARSRSRHEERHRGSARPRSRR